MSEYSVVKTLRLTQEQHEYILRVAPKSDGRGGVNEYIRKLIQKDMKRG